MRDLLIIASFFVARLSQSVQVFLMRFFDETLVHIILNLACILVIVGVLKQTRRTKRLAQERIVPVREYCIGFRRMRKGDVLLGLYGTAILLSLGAVFSALKIFPTPIVPTFFSTSSFFFATVLLVLAAFVEEVFFRSYIIALLQHLRLNAVFTVLFSAFPFAVAHISYGIYGVLFASSAGIILSCLMVMRKSLWANTIAHAVYNMVIYYLTLF